MPHTEQAFRGVKDLLQKKDMQLQTIERQIVDLLDTLEAQPEGNLFLLSQQLESLRFERNKNRSEFLDLESNLKLLKRKYFEQKLIATVTRDAPALLQRIEEQLTDVSDFDVIEEQHLLQQRATCYRKLDSSFKDQESMQRQKHYARALGKEDAEWEARLEFALIRSKRYFSKQCSKIRHLRERLFALHDNEHSHQFYLMAVHIIGQDEVSQLATHSSFRLAA